MEGSSERSSTSPQQVFLVIEKWSLHVTLDYGCTAYILFGSRYDHIHDMDATIYERVNLMFIIFYYIILYYIGIIWYYIILYYIILGLYYNILYYIVYNIILYYIILYYIILGLYFIILHYIMLFYTGVILYYIVLYYIILY